MDVERVRAYFNDRRTVDHYVRAVANVGLWESERRVLERWLDRDAAILDLGCGAGRIALGLWKLGYRGVEGADLAESMVAEAREIASYLGAAVSFSREDATSLNFHDERFEAIVFGFNGLMQIPGRAERRQALREIHRILKPGGLFIFTTLDREDTLYQAVFEDRANFEHDIARNPNLREEGDRHFDTEHGTTFMHVPWQSEVKADLGETGWRLRESSMRSEIAVENPSVEDFSEDCRFWVAQKPL